MFCCLIYFCSTPIFYTETKCTFFIILNILVCYFDWLFCCLHGWCFPIFKNIHVFFCFLLCMIFCYLYQFFNVNFLTCQFIFSICHIYLFILPIMYKMSEIVGLHEFVGVRPIISFSDFISSKDESLFIVVACYFGVDESVDKCIDHQSPSLEPRWMILRSSYFCFYHFKYDEYFVFLVVNGMFNLL